ncbi:TWiK family of potassium channels protein 7-like isoform X1 [Ornithodoros turicata]|uniref:TWiK family of potassium channels protein 7-like isoform X1 n=1 Tax=Ornithodoros turicata TaxID=34597 RepID=UPI003138B4E3
MALERKRSSRRGRPPVRRRPPENKCKACCKKLTAFLFSHVGLCALVVGYSLLGAFAFKALESPYEVQKASQVRAMREETVARLWAITDRLNVLYKDNWTASVEKEIRHFQTRLIAAVKDGYDGKESESTQQWSFSGAFLYSLTVITTIGYGNIAPKTNWGKVVTILYAIVGIPLMLLYLTNIGDILAKAFKYVYGRLCSCESRQQQRRRPPLAEHYRVHHIVVHENAQQLPNSNACSKKLPNSITRSNPSGPLHEDEVKVEGLTDDFLDDTEYERPRVTVPITLCMAIITGYICGGAVLFSIWEDWNYLDGSYFCFVTLSTIGFGDLVPGDNVVSDSGSQEKLVICSLYLLTGLALIAMCFNLVQEEVVHKIRTVGQRLGMISDSEDSDD